MKETIGKEIEITGCSNNSLNGVKGKIVDESLNTFTIKTEKKSKIVMKNIIQFKMDGKWMSGLDFLGRPEERRYS